MPTVSCIQYLGMQCIERTMCYLCLCVRYIYVWNLQGATMYYIVTLGLYDIVSALLARITGIFPLCLLNMTKCQKHDFQWLFPTVWMRSHLWKLCSAPLTSDVSWLFTASTLLCSWAWSGPQLCFLPSPVMSASPEGLGHITSPEPAGSSRRWTATVHGLACWHITVPRKKVA